MKWLEGRVLPRRLGALGQVVGISAGHAGGPWLLSLLSVRHGWTDGRPGLWNLLGLIPVAAGAAFLYWCIRVHYISAPQGWRFEKTPHYPTPAYLLTSGPYRYSRNPIYLSYLLIWPGWIAFYGSFAILIALILLAVFVGPVVVPREERGLEARFGDAYRQYARKTPRWL
jgi:protein-S-isoprenylcysteine O-methyltransferase Ste14